MKNIFLSLFLIASLKVFSQEKIASENQFNSSIIIDASLSPQGELSGTLVIYDQGFSSRIRKSLMKQAPDDFRQHYQLDHFLNLKIHSINIDSTDTKNGILMTTILFSFPGFGKISDQSIYLLPALVPLYNENPYADAPGSYPFQLAFPLNFTFQLEVKMPVGYTAEDFPQNKIISYPGADATLKRISRFEEQQFSFLVDLSIDQTSYTSQQYPDLKQLIDDYISVSSEPFGFVKR